MTRADYMSCGTGAVANTCTIHTIGRTHSATERRARISVMAMKLSVIIPVRNERPTIASVIRECRVLDPAAEVLVVANGTTDGSVEIARREGANVIAYDAPLGHDVGRSVGARHASGDILLFLDGDMVIPAAKLEPFVRLIREGADVVLNDYSGNVQTKQPHDVVVAKHVLNSALRRPDLRGLSLAAVPHALSRKAAERIGFENLAVPPLAHAMAVYGGLNIRTAPTVHVGKLNPRRSHRYNGDPTGRLMMGDHLEALAWLLAQTDRRGNRHDFGRRRNEVRSR